MLFYFFPPPRGREKLSPFLFQNSQNYFTLTIDAQRDGSVTLHPIRVVAHSIRSVVREYTLAARR